MAIEIERKFLLTSMHWRNQVLRTETMAQGYLNDAASVQSGAQRSSVRVRIQDEQAFLNIKSVSIGTTRQEFDYPLPLSDAQALLALCVGPVLQKQRHYLRHGAHLWEIDEFAGENAGLFVAEVELSDAAEPFEKPAWLGVEVTHLPRYYNLALASYPYTQWSAAEQAATDALQQP